MSPVSDDVAPAYPRDPRDGWEPGAPSLRAMAPSTIGGALVPLGVYFAIRRAIGSDTPALAIAGIPAAAWVTIQWVRQRRIDPIGMTVLVGFFAGVGVSYALGGSAFVLKIRDAAITAAFGVLCLGSLRLLPRPLMFYFGRVLAAGEDPIRLGIYDQLWELPRGRHSFRVITYIWGVGLICDASVRVLLARLLPTGTFLAVAFGVDAVIFPAMFALSVWFSQRTRDQPAAQAISPL